MIIDVSENMERDENVTAVQPSYVGSKMLQGGSRRPIIFVAEGGDVAQPGLCKDTTGGKHIPGSIITEVWVEAKVAQ